MLNMNTLGILLQFCLASGDHLLGDYGTDVSLLTGMCITVFIT